MQNDKSYCIPPFFISEKGDFSKILNCATILQRLLYYTVSINKTNNGHEER